MLIGTAVLDSPIGSLTVFAVGANLCALTFPGRAVATAEKLRARFPAASIQSHPDPAGAVSGLSDYFKGDLDALDRLRVDPVGTPFQVQVWAALRQIPVGQTISYSELALRIGRPTAVRAVAAANGRNPIAIVIPCHRVIAADGTLWGYGGGLGRKRWLLEHESAKFVGTGSSGAGPSAQRTLFTAHGPA
jgi:methylated-DNA-[protein]-cysteine S-methyltransferase